ncbi:MAG: glycosyltransferase family 4 protein, partial [Bacteroidales bacterium]|nr:glycosyltransferase family 4 protein [Bacteroidales bacterium]
FHIGTMNWIPNEEGIKWFIEEVWIKVTRTLPDLRLFLAGRSMPDWLTGLKDQTVEVVGEVPEAKEFINQHAIMIAPILSGGGIRIKIIEGLAMGRAVISTSIGAEGINYSNNKNILIADSPEEFANSIIKCARDEQLCIKLGRNARILMEEEYDRKAIITRLEAFYNSVIKN